MGIARGSARRVLIFQGLLIVLPVLVLATLGFQTLRKDRLLLEHEAKAQAEELAAAALHRLWTVLAQAGSNQPTFQVLEGELVFPLPYDLQPVPQPWSDGDGLPDQQAALWNTAQRTGDPDSLRSFLATEPPRPWMEAARYRLGLRLAEIGDRAAALEIFETIDSTLSEAGVPLVPLARWKVLELMDGMSEAVSRDRFKRAVDSCLSEATSQPSVLTELLFQRVAVVAARRDLTEVYTLWEQRWERDQLARRLFAQAAVLLQDRHQWPALFELTAEVRWLLVRQEKEGNRFAAFAITPDLPLLEQENLGAIMDTIRVPPHLALQLELVNGGAEAERIAEGSLLAVQIRGELREAHLRAAVLLVDPQTFYAQLRQRSLWFGALVALAVVVAISGYWLARKALLRQIALNEMQANFVSSVSHELRSPLAALRLMSEGLDRGTVAEPARQKEYFRLMVRECRRLAGMIENVLTLSRSDRNVQHYEREPTDLLRLVSETVELIKPVAVDREVRLETQLPNQSSHHPHLDGRAVQQALINLIDNAIKHSGGTVVIGLEEAEDKTRIWVQDHGPGIPPEDQERIFKRFYRQGSELRRETTGIGIGLSIVKRIVEDMNGRVWIESENGVGSRFVMEFGLAAVISKQ